MATDVTDLRRRALRATVVVLLALAALLFTSAWTLRYWQAWVFWLVYAVGTISTTLYFLDHDPKLVERRLAGGPTAETATAQKIIMTAASACFILLIVVPGIDHRLRWSAVPPALVVLADLGIAVGFLLTFLVLKENSYAAATIQVAAGQTVISTGLYRIVRHPMYAGGLLMLGLTPLALGSCWALPIVVAMVPVLVWRLIDEERFLTHNLAGYADYCRGTRYRLVPWLW